MLAHCFGCFQHVEYSLVLQVQSWQESFLGLPSETLPDIKLKSQNRSCEQDWVAKVGTPNCLSASGGHIAIGGELGAILCVPQAALSGNGNASIFLLQEGPNYLRTFFTRSAIFIRSVSLGLVQHITGILRQVVAELKSSTKRKQVLYCTCPSRERDLHTTNTVFCCGQVRTGRRSIQYQGHGCLFMWCVWGWIRLTCGGWE